MLSSRKNGSMKKVIKLRPLLSQYKSFSKQIFIMYTSPKFLKLFALTIVLSLNPLFAQSVTNPRRYEACKWFVERAILEMVKESEAKRPDGKSAVFSSFFFTMSQHLYTNEATKETMIGSLLELLAKKEITMEDLESEEFMRSYLESFIQGALEGRDEAIEEERK